MCAIKHLWARLKGGLKAFVYPVILGPGTEKSHQKSSARKFDPERAVWNLFDNVIVYDFTTHTATLPTTSPLISMAMNVINLNKFILKSIVFQVQKKNQLLVSDPEWQISVSGFTMSHSSLGHTSTGICDIVSPSTEICQCGTDTIPLLT